MVGPGDGSWGQRDPVTANGTSTTAAEANVHMHVAYQCMSNTQGERGREGDRELLVPDVGTPLYVGMNTVVD
jgi:hypothetical protein